MSARDRQGVFYQLGRLAGQLGSDDGSTGGAGTGSGSAWRADPSEGMSMQVDDQSGGGLGPGVLFAGLLIVLGVAVSFYSIPTALGLFALAFAVFVVSHSVVIVQAYERQTYTVLGAYVGVLEPGINVVPPFISGTRRFDMRTTMIDVPHQEAITRDNSPVRSNAVVYVHVMDPKKAFLEVDDYERAVGLLAQTTLRAVIGDMELDQTLSEREEINRRISEELDEPTDAWGIRVEAVEVKEVMPSDAVKHAMEQQSGAERRRRAAILEAQGERQSMVERAMGEKTSAVMRAEGSKKAEIIDSQGGAVARVLRARAAESMGERAIIERGFEALERVGQGASTTYVLPQELTSLLGRYGKHLTGGSGSSSPLEGKGLDAVDADLIGLDDLDELVAEMDADDLVDGEHGDPVDIEIED